MLSTLIASINRKQTMKGIKIKPSASKPTLQHVKSTPPSLLSISHSERPSAPLHAAPLRSTPLHAAPRHSTTLQYYATAHCTSLCRSLSPQAINWSAASIRAITFQRSSSRSSIHPEVTPSSLSFAPRRGCENPRRGSLPSPCGLAARAPVCPQRAATHAGPLSGAAPAFLSFSAEVGDKASI